MLRFTNQTSKQSSYSKTVLLENTNRLTFIAGFLKSIYLLDEKVCSIEGGSLIQCGLGINKITEEQLNFIGHNMDIDKETLTSLVENIINSACIDLLDQSKILVSRATVRDISRNCFVIVVSANHLKLQGRDIEQFFPINYLTLAGVDVPTFFQILSNNYKDKRTKLDFLTFFARHANQDGFLHMGQTHLYASALQQGIHIQIAERKCFIFMDNQPTTQVKILEYFKIDQLMQGGNVQRIFAIIGLSSIIDVTKKHKIVNQELFVYAEDSIAEKLSKIIGGTWCKNYTNKSSWNINLHTVGSFFQKLWSDEDHLATIVHHSKMSRAFCGNKRGNISYMRSAMYPRLSIL